MDEEAAGQERIDSMRDPVHPLKSCHPSSAQNSLKTRQNHGNQKHRRGWSRPSSGPSRPGFRYVPACVNSSQAESLRRLRSPRRGRGAPGARDGYPSSHIFFAWLHPYRPCLGRVRTGRRTAPAGLPRVCAFQLAVLPSPCRTLYKIRTKLTLRTGLQNTCGAGHSRGAPRG